MPYEAYIGYLTDGSQKTRPEVIAGEPFVIELRDLDTFERLVVRAIVAEPPAKVRVRAGAVGARLGREPHAGCLVHSGARGD